MILDVALEKLILTLEKLPLADCSFRKNDCISWLSGKKYLLDYEIAFLICVS